VKYFTNTKFLGVGLSPAAAIIKARNKEHAVEVLASELRKAGLEQEDAPLRPEDMKLWPLMGEQVRILNDGDY